MAIKRVLLPVSPDKSFEPLADAAFHIGDKFSAQVMGLFVQAPALVIPMFNDAASVAEVGTIAATARERRREAAAKAESMFKAAAERFPHVDSTFRSITGDVEASFVRHGRLSDISVIVPLIRSKTASGARPIGSMCRTPRCFAPVARCCSCRRMR